MKHFTLMFCLLAVPMAGMAQEAKGSSKSKKKMESATFSGLKFRSIGPALMSGRIADIAIHPSQPNTWYVAVGSGNLWKTVNAGTTWTPIFEKYTSYSIGCVTIDPNQPTTIWVGSGEAVGGRHAERATGLWKRHDLNRDLIVFLDHLDRDEVLRTRLRWDGMTPADEMALTKELDSGHAEFRFRGPEGLRR